MRYIPTPELCEGDILANTILDQNGNTLVRSNTHLSAYMIKRLIEDDYPGVYIYDNISKGILADESIPLDLRFATIKSYKHLDLDDCIFLSHQIAESLSDSKEIATELSGLSDHDQYTYNHSVNVAVLAAKMGIILGYNANKVKDLTTAGLLHDIGKTEIPNEIICKKGPLTIAEQEKMREHAQIGYEICKGNILLPAVVKSAVLSHHERMDGSGYPQGLKGAHIHEFARILAICDVYDAMVSKRTYKDAINPAAVVEHLYTGAGTLFDFELTQVFIQNLVPYPTGMLCWLSDGTRVVVKENVPGWPLRPVVVRMDSTEISLMNELNLTITGFATTPIAASDL